MKLQELGPEAAPKLLLLRGSGDARWALLAVALSQRFHLLLPEGWEGQSQWLARLMDRHFSSPDQISVCGPARCWKTLYPALQQGKGNSGRVLLEAEDLYPGSFLGRELLGQDWENSFV